MHVKDFKLDPSDPTGGARSSTSAMGSAGRSSAPPSSKIGYNGWMTIEAPINISIDGAGTAGSS